MILFESLAIRLDYSPSTDILTADLSGTHEFYLLEVREALKTISETVRYYDVKRLLMDSRKRVLHIDSVTYRALMIDFTKDLKSTRLEKFARMNSGVDIREDIADYIKENIATTLLLRTFTDKEKAMEWLTTI